MNAPRGSSFTAANNQTEVWRNIETALQAIQTHCNQFLSQYHQLAPQQTIALIEAIEVQNFLLQDLFAQVAPTSSPTDTTREQQG